MRFYIDCTACGAATMRRNPAKFCHPCSRARAKNSGALWAHGRVRWAVMTGELPNILTRRCVDCGAQAAHYDHRDYNRPLDVEPVCRSCNSRRGPAIHRGA